LYYSFEPSAFSFNFLAMPNIISHNLMCDVYFLVSSNSDFLFHCHRNYTRIEPASEKLSKLYDSLRTINIYYLTRFFIGQLVAFTGRPSPTETSMGASSFQTIQQSTAKENSYGSLS